MTLELPWAGGKNEIDTDAYNVQKEWALVQKWVHGTAK